MTLVKFKNIMDNNNLFYLNGFQRSGTTLLCHLLDKHPEILCIEEPEISKRIVYKQFNLLADIEFDSIKQAIDFYGVDPLKYSSLVKAYLAKKMDNNAFLINCYELFNLKGARKAGAKEVVDLTAFKYGYFKKLMKFHNQRLKIISLERDIKGVVNSFIKLGFFPPGKRKISEYNIKRFAKAYVKCLNNRDRYLPKETYMLIYENFMDEPEKELYEIFEFMEVDTSERLIQMVLHTHSRGIRNNFKGIVKKRSTGWQLSLSKGQVQWFDKLYAKKRTHRWGK